MKTETNRYTIWSGVGVFCACMLLSAMVFAFFSPTVATKAADNMTSTWTANVNPVISVTAPAASAYSFGTVTPTASGQFASQSGTVQVKTNNVAGYKLYISNNTSETRMVASGSDTYITACGSGVTSSTMVKNTWGYSTDGTNYYPISASNTQIAQQASPLTQTSAYSHTVHIGMKIGSDLKSGTYSNVIKFTAITN